MFWLRPGLERTAPLIRASATASVVSGPMLDTAIFDVDGVLVDTRRSYRLSVIAATDRLVRTVQGLPDAPVPLLTPQTVGDFKLAGGFNNDWHATQVFVALWTARLREWRGMPLADVPLDEWARRAGAAAREGRGGLVWLHATVPASAIPPLEVARWAHDEVYWGARRTYEHYGHQPLYAPEAPGLVDNEDLLLDGTVLPALVRAGITRLGIITGRVGPEVAWAVRRLTDGGTLPEGADGTGTVWHESRHGRSPFAAILTGDDYSKPEPLALAVAVRALAAHGALYVGDTADDLDLVLRYRRELQPVDAALPPVLAVMVAQGAERQTYQERGADLVLAHIGELPAALLALAARATPPR